MARQTWEVESQKIFDNKLPISASTNSAGLRKPSRQMLSSVLKNLIGPSEPHLGKLKRLLRAFKDFLRPLRTLNSVVQWFKGCSRAQGFKGRFQGFLAYAATWFTCPGDVGPTSDGPPNISIGIAIGIAGNWEAGATP